MTIVEAIKAVLKESPEPQTIDQVHARIMQRQLYSFKAVDPKSVVRSQLRRHCLELDFPSASPVKFFRLVGEDKYALESEDGVRAAVPKKPTTTSGRLPEEIIEDAFNDHLVAFREQLKEKILQTHPAFFEQLVIDLLVRMGYGGGDPKLGIHTGRPGDGGIDGIIKEDKLGLEKIYIQAKRYALSRKVTPGEVQKFAGAMNKVKKGVFLTTSKFAKSALDFVKSHEKTISLIDGDMLCDLMIMHGVGITDVKAYRVMRIDNDYFSPNE